METAPRQQERSETMKKFICLLVSVGMLLSLTACGKKAPPDTDLDKTDQVVELTVWGAEEDEALLQEIFDSFQSHYAGEASFRITFQPQSESSCKDALLADLEGGPDVFTFADDQVAALAAAGGLDPIENAEEIRSVSLSVAVDAASVSGELYAYPLTADNGYFLYYNKAYFSPEDVESMDRLLAAAAEAGGLFAMDWSSAWYVYAFFGNTGLEVGLNADGLTNYCTWNDTEGPITGVDVAQAMLDIAASPAFSNRTDTEFMEGVRSGTVVAGISGVWNAVSVQEAWGDNYGACKLPTYTCNGKQIQMASFKGYKMFGVNAYSEHAAWAHKLAEWITNEENQILRFQERSQGPANIVAASSDEVGKVPAIAAVIDQAQYGVLQRVGNSYWDACTSFADTIAAGNPDNIPLQDLMDRLVSGIAASVV